MEDIDFSPRKPGESAPAYIRRKYGLVAGEGPLSQEEQAEVSRRIDLVHPLEDRPTASRSLVDRSTDRGRRVGASFPDDDIGATSFNHDTERIQRIIEDNLTDK